MLDIDCAHHEAQLQRDVQDGGYETLTVRERSELLLQAVIHLDSDDKRLEVRVTKIGCHCLMWLRRSEPARPRELRSNR